MREEKIIRILSLFLVVLTLVGAISLTLSAAYGDSTVYPEYSQNMKEKKRCSDLNSGKLREFMV